MSRFTLSICISVVLLLTTSCAQSQKVVPEATDETVVSATPPFRTKEPERYRATRTITSVTAAAVEEVTKHAIARDGELRRDELELDGQRVVYLTLPEGTFVFLPHEKAFAEATDVEHLESGEESESSPDRLLHTESISTTYQRIGVESLNGRTTQKYRVTVNSSPGANVSVSESMIWIDDALQIPIKAETKAINGGRSTMELSEIALEVDQSLFRIPEGYEKMTFTELRKRLKRE